jgi:hypothetical protein
MFVLIMCMSFKLCGLLLICKQVSPVALLVNGQVLASPRRSANDLTPASDASDASGPKDRKLLRRTPRTTGRR